MSILPDPLNSFFGRRKNGDKITDPSALSCVNKTQSNDTISVSPDSAHINQIQNSEKSAKSSPPADEQKIKPDTSNWIKLEMTLDGNIVRKSKPKLTGGYNLKCDMSVGDEIYCLYAREFKGYGGGGWGNSSPGRMDIYYNFCDDPLVTTWDDGVDFDNMFEKALIKLYRKEHHINTINCI